MKNTSLIAMFLLAFAPDALADGPALPNVTVYGTATTEVTPDLMNWNLTVTNKGSDLAAVAEEHSRIVAGVLKLLKDNDISDEKVQTARMEFGENWEYRDHNRVKLGYYAKTQVSFELADFEKYKSLWSGLAQIEHVSIDYVGYDHSKRIEYQNETRIKALKAAKEKANDLATTLGSQIGEPLLIEEELALESTFHSNFMENSLSFPFSDPESPQESGVAKGTIPIRTRVRVSFRLITNE